MKKLRENAYELFLSERSAEDAERLERFFRAFEEHCLLRSAEKLKLRADFEKAILYYHQTGKTVEEMLGRLSIRKMGGFYARPASAWFPLDDAAKIYPLSMGHNSMSVFRLSAYLKTQVVPELLQIALDFTITRFPSFATTLKKGFFWHYLDSSKRRFSAEPDYAVPCRALTVSRSGSQSFRVLYFQNRISVEFFHVLTDGTGGMEFLKALTAEYLRLTGVAIPKENLMDSEDLPNPEEIENAFAKVDRSGTGSGFVDKMAVQMSGRLSDIKPCRVVHLKMNADEIKAAAKKYQATVTAYLLGVMFLAQRAATEQMQGDVSIQVPVNMRKFYPSRTVRNFALYCGIRLPLQELRRPGGDRTSHPGSADRKGFPGIHAPDAGFHGKTGPLHAVYSPGPETAGGQTGVWLPGRQDFFQHPLQPGRRQNPGGHGPADREHGLCAGDDHHQPRRMFRCDGQWHHHLLHCQDHGGSHL